MEIYVLFGQPGTGKTFIGKIMQKDFDFYLYDGDQDMSQELKDAIVNEAVTDELRSIFFNKLIISVKKLKTKYTKIVVSQTFIKEKYREQFKKIFPHTKFILVETKTDIRENRLMFRDRFELPLEKWRNMALLFELPKIDHTIIYNDEDGEESIKKQLTSVIASD